MSRAFMDDLVIFSKMTPWSPSPLARTTCRNARAGLRVPSNFGHGKMEAMATSSVSFALFA